MDEPRQEPKASAAEPHAPKATADGEAALGHFVGDGGGYRSAMVDVGAKTAGARSALARARVVLTQRAWERLVSIGNPKGPAEEMARAAGVLAAKRTDELIPLCHTLALDHVDVWFAWEERAAVSVYCRARCRAATGVEMEALVGATLAALTLYDMWKGLDHGIRVEAVELLEKDGGRSGPWRAPGWSPDGSSAGPPG